MPEGGEEEERKEAAKDSIKKKLKKDVKDDNESKEKLTREGSKGKDALDKEEDDGDEKKTSSRL